MAATLSMPFGAVIGSFATTAGLRWAKDEQSLQGRSHCDICDQPLTFSDTVPILSYIGLRGVCRCCASPIDIAHPVGEMIGACTAGIAFAVLAPLPAVLTACVAFSLLAASTADLKVQRLPDSAALLTAGLALYLSGAKGLPRLLEGVMAAAIALLLLLVVRRGFLALRGKPGLGLGDIKLIAALALWLGVWTPWAVVIAAVMGLFQLAILGSYKGRIAFGPALAVAGWGLGLAVQAGAVTAP